MQILNLILAQTQGGGMSGIFMIVAMIVIFYFFMIRPQQRKQKKIKEQREALTKGDRIVTAGGIHGRISADKGSYMMIEIAPGVTIRVEKNMIYPADSETPVANTGKKEAKQETAKTGKQAPEDVEAEEIKEK